MKQALAVLAVFASLGLLGLVFAPRIRCAARGYHRPRRKHGAIGFECQDCPKTGSDLESMGEDVDLDRRYREAQR